MKNYDNDTILRVDIVGVDILGVDITATICQLK